MKREQFFNKTIKKLEIYRINENRFQIQKYIFIKPKKTFFVAVLLNGKNKEKRIGHILYARKYDAVNRGRRYFRIKQIIK